MDTTATSMVRDRGQPGEAKEAPAAEGDERVVIEPRWPIALALGSFIAITIVLRAVQPHRESLGPHWLIPGIEIALLVVLLAADPVHVSRRRRWLRPLSIVLVLSLAVVHWSPPPS